MTPLRNDCSNHRLSKFVEFNCLFNATWSNGGAIIKKTRRLLIYSSLDMAPYEIVINFIFSVSHPSDSSHDDLRGSFLYLVLFFMKRSP